MQLHPMVTVFFNIFLFFCFNSLSHLFRFLFSLPSTADLNLLFLYRTLCFSLFLIFFPENLISSLSLRSVQSSLGSMNRLRSNTYQDLSRHKFALPGLCFFLTINISYVWCILVVQIYVKLLQVKVSEVNLGMAPPSHLLDSEIPKNLNQKQVFISPTHLSLSLS